MRANRWTGLAVLIVFGVGASSLWAMPEELDRSAETSARRVQLLGAKQHARSRGMRPEPEKEEKEEEKKRAAKGRQAGGGQKRTVKESRPIERTAAWFWTGRKR